jgi:hypothetical protein
MEKSGFRHPEQRVRLPAWQKAWFGLRMMTA